MFLEKVFNKKGTIVPNISAKINARQGFSYYELSVLKLWMTLFYNAGIHPNNQL